MTRKSMHYKNSAFILFIFKFLKGNKKENKSIVISDIVNYCETNTVYHGLVIATVTKRNNTVFSELAKDWQADDWLSHIIGVGSRLMFNINEPELLYKPSKETISKIVNQFRIIGIDVKEIHLKYGKCIIIHHIV